MCMRVRVYPVNAHILMCRRALSHPHTHIHTVLIVTGMIFHFLYVRGGAWAIFKYWFMPYLVFNFWLSTYTYFHHKSPEIGWLEVCRGVF